VTTIPFEQGVCGTCAVEGKSQLVEDVESHPNHIACDENSKSELVVPLFLKATPEKEQAKEVVPDIFLGVLDMDSPVRSFFLFNCIVVI
jgi:GAF domain-containing protein